MCWEATTLAESARKVEAMKQQQDCSKYEVRKDGCKWIANTVCKIDASTVSTLTTSEFNGENAYRVDTNSTFDPPEDGNLRFRMVMDENGLGHANEAHSGSSGADSRDSHYCL